MTKWIDNIIKSIAVIGITVMLFSCTNDLEKVRDFLADKNLPIGVAKNVYNIHTDSGRVDMRFTAPLLFDFSNRKAHPYSEFPEGVRVVSFENSKDSLVIIGDYAISYSKTSISEIKGNVEIENFKERKKLLTEQLFWDQRIKYFYTEKPFILYTDTDTIRGTGFDANEDLSQFMAKNNRGTIYLNKTED
ncbi:MAG: LPS export ABC transporter periplasmic protein LptC [Flavobacteriaceae bacterium]|nr:LPS export ABC transporter periplasmic protein LptC [Flavobacteriaceae bacterium]